MTEPPKLTEDQVLAVSPGYSEIEEFDAGGFKTVYKAKKAEATEVIKVVGIPRGDGSQDDEKYREECVGRVRREVEILQRCSTPFLVKPASLPLAHHSIDGFDYVVYSEEFLEGVDLWKLIKGGVLLSDEAEAKLLMKCLLLAISELWSMRYIHRDIKPRNVIRHTDPDRPFVLIDLGIAFSLIETGLTYNPAHIPATFRYFAPEMGDPDFRQNLDYRADLYTAALTVFESASGVHPIANSQDDAIRTITRAMRQPPRRLGSLRSDFSPGFCSLIDQLLKKKPALRPANLERLIHLMET